MYQTGINPIKPTTRILKKQGGSESFSELVIKLVKKWFFVGSNIGVRGVQE